MVAPDDPEAQFRAGQQSVIEVLIDAVDPVAENYAGFLASGLVVGHQSRDHPAGGG